MRVRSPLVTLLAATALVTTAAATSGAAPSLAPRAAGSGGGAAGPPAAVSSVTAVYQPTFPIRAAFYYPWFPEAWDQAGIFPFTQFDPTEGWYDSGDRAVIARHVAAMKHGDIDAGIASWWGRGHPTDGRIDDLLAASAGTRFRWALYYEAEGYGNPTAAQIRADLLSIKARFASKPQYLRVNGKFVVFVYADPADACGMATRWKNAGVTGAYIVLKVFSGYTGCAAQPSGWHQYGPAVSYDAQLPWSVTVSPGFWKAGEGARLARSVSRWETDVQAMVASGAQWQLVTTFNEWGEGTSVEPATQWPSPSGYGDYLDVLHDHPIP